MSKVADVDISDTLMVDWLYLPENTKIIGAEYNHIRHCVTLRVVNPNLPNAVEGDGVPRCNALFRKNDEGQIEFTGWQLKS